MIVMQPLGNHSVCHPRMRQVEEREPLCQRASFRREVAAESSAGELHLRIQHRFHESHMRSLVEEMIVVVDLTQKSFLSLKVVDAKLQQLFEYSPQLCLEFFRVRCRLSLRQLQQTLNNSSQRFVLCVDGWYAYRVRGRPCRHCLCPGGRRGPETGEEREERADVLVIECRHPLHHLAHSLRDRTNRYLPHLGRGSAQETPSTRRLNRLFHFVQPRRHLAELLETCVSGCHHLCSVPLCLHALGKQRRHANNVGEAMHDILKHLG
mmetsp:Transcript_24547/g.57979  ORF Transcript_24547/g.57979 Transcript_24547/m.57979 type:complete len:265 (+) Transcript_24547:175-969(+)